MRSLLDLAGQISLPERRPLTIQSGIHDLLPAFICLYATGLLVLLPRTFAIRLALLPITLWATFRATTLVDLSFGRDEYNFWNQSLAVLMFCESLRACMWTFKLDPLTRLTNTKPKLSSHQLWFDAFDLFFNLRGIGWSWSQGLHIPKETRNTKSTTRFLLTTLLWLIQGLVEFDFCDHVVQIMLLKSNGALTGSIFDQSLPPLLRYTHSTIITLLAGFVIFVGVENQYNFTTLIACTIFQQSPTLWPPVSDRPFRSTSLHQFWSTRWHQSFRDIFVNCGGKPFAFLFGKVGGVMGVFLLSGVLHDLGCWALGGGADPMKVTGFFLMNGVGVVLEQVFKLVTGKRVGGMMGLLWTWIWVVGWANLLIDAWFERGLATSMFLPHAISPSYHLHKFLFP